MYWLLYFMTNNYFRLFKIETKRTNLECEHWKSLSISLILPGTESRPGQVTPIGYE